MMKLQSWTVPVMLALVVLVIAGVEGGWKKRVGRRGCRRAAGQGVMEEGPGDRFRWTMTGLDDDDLRVTYLEGAFAPEGARHVFKYPRDRGQRALGLVPAKLLYDFTRPEEPVAVIRQGRRGRGVCIVLSSDVDSYDELMDTLMIVNGTNRDVEEAEDAISVAVVRTRNDSQFSEVVRNACSQDQCGRPIDPVYFKAREEGAGESPEEEAGEEEEDGEDGVDAMFEPSVHLFTSRVVITGLPDPRQMRWMRRQARRQHRRQNGQDTGAGRQWAMRRHQRRQQRRQQRRERRRQTQAAQ